MIQVSLSLRELEMKTVVLCKSFHNGIIKLIVAVGILAITTDASGQRFKLVPKLGSAEKFQRYGFDFDKATTPRPLSVDANADLDIDLRRSFGLQGGCGASCSIASESVSMTESEIEILNDPFGLLVFRDHAKETDFATIIKLLKNDRDLKHSVFVVGEWIKQPQGDRFDQRRRAVLSFDGELSKTVMISFAFNEKKFPKKFDRSTGVAEIWGWDETSGQFQFYELSKIDDEFQWVHSGSSPQASDSFPFKKSNACMECHLNGAPVMKELTRPWNNWFSSTTSNNSYLQKGGNKSWESINNEELYELSSAENLEGRIRDSINNFVRRIIRDNLSDEGGDSKRVTNFRRMMRHVVTTTEFNLTSSDLESGLTPFDSSSASPTGTAKIPNSLFLNSKLISTLKKNGGQPLRIANDFQNVANLEMNEYAALVKERGIQMAAQMGENVPLQFQAGFDCNFPWFTPEPSFIDNEMTRRLIKSKLITPELVAAIQLVDLRTPILSTVREELFNTPGLIPDSIVIPNVPGSHDEHPLSIHIIKELKSLSPLSSSSHGKLLAILQSDKNPIDQLEEELKSYLEEIKKQFDVSSNERDKHIGNWFSEMLARRRLILKHPTQSALDETAIDGAFRRSQALLPTP